MYLIDTLPLPCTLIAYTQDQHVEHIFMVDFTKIYFTFRKIQLNKRVQLSVYRQSTLVQLCFAELCSTAQSIHVSL